jgi:CubicO group peptidase (beta-lactamase class C family)
MTEPTINGFCDEKFQPVMEAFAKNFKLDLELGAAFAVAVDGQTVVDLWAGYVDPGRDKLWEENTLVPVASNSKIICALCGMMLLDRGLIELDAPVARYWPEFAANGKESLPVRYLFCHASGLAGLDEALTWELLFDWDRVISLLGQQKPWWEPGTQSGYHGFTFGYLLGELVRRTTGKTLGQFFREEVAEIIGADFYIGLPESEVYRVAEVQNNTGGARAVSLDSMAYRVNGDLQQTIEIMNDPRWLGAEIPAANGIGNARSLVKVGSLLARGGELDGHRLMSEATAKLAYEEQIYTHDLVMDMPVRFGLGFGLTSKEVPLPFPNAFHWGGYGGSATFMVPEHGASWSYVINLFDSFIGGDSRSFRLNKATIASLEAL